MEIIFKDGKLLTNHELNTNYMLCSEKGWIRYFNSIEELIKKYPKYENEIIMLKLTEEE